MPRAYELMTIFDRDVEESVIDGMLNRVDEMVAGGGGAIVATDKWGLRKFAYPIDHKDDGFYVVNQITTEARDLADADRFLRLADEVVRHKIVRLPEREAARRGLFDGTAEGVSAAPPPPPAGGGRPPAAPAPDEATEEISADTTEPAEPATDE